MAQFDVYKNTNNATMSTYPYLVDIQSDLLSELRTTVVIPLISRSNHPGSQLETLHPEFKILGKKYIALTTLIAGIDRKALGDCITSFSDNRDDIISAIDLLVTGI